jgi:rod shape-determining protein MreC
MRSTRRARLVLTILLLAAFSLITLDYRTGALEGVRRGAGDVFGPIENGVGDVTHPIGSWFSSIGHLGSYKSQNEALRADIARLEGKLNLTVAERDELAQDQKLLHLAGIAQYSIVAARVVAYGSADGFDETATINRGSANGITTGMTVIAGNGLVGRTIHVSRSISTILLANDPTFSIGVRAQGKALEIGTAQGTGINKPLALQMFNNTALLTPGEALVSFGSTNDKPFVPEVPVGKILNVDPPGGLERTATVSPFVDFTAINIVAVVTHAPPNIKHDSLLPQKPTPTPTPTVTVRVTVNPSGSPIGTSAPHSGPTGTPHGTASSSSTP